MVINYSYFARIIIMELAAGFIAITFLQSALDKIFDYKGNLSWLMEQFNKTFLRGMIGIFLPVLLVLELLTGLLCVWGGVLLFRGKGPDCLMSAFLLSGITLLVLLFGQRVSKQYPGAASLTGYFIVTLVGLLALMYSPA
jgi:hypothetical protein